MKSLECNKGIFLNIFIILKFCIYVYVYSYVHKSTDICGVQKRVSHTPELQEAVSCPTLALGLKLGPRQDCRCS